MLYNNLDYSLRRVRRRTERRGAVSVNDARPGGGAAGRTAKASPFAAAGGAGFGLMLAPMAGVTDSAMRTVCADFGAACAVTEMVSAKALVYEQRSRDSAPAKTAALCRVAEYERIPVAVQLFGSDPDFMAEAAALVSTGSYRGFSGRVADAVDINMGCPVKKVAGNGEGAALMKDPGLIYRIVSACSAASALPVSVKLRAGWDTGSVNAPECAAAAEAGGASLVCVHARTRDAFYRPGIMPEVIARTKEAVSVPVFGNGDVFSAADALRLLRETGCDGVAVARGAVGKPMIFSEILAAAEGRPYCPPDGAAVLAAALKQLDIAVAEKGDRRGAAESKYAISHYADGRPGAAAFRAGVMAASTADGIRRVLTGFFGGPDAAQQGR